MSVAVLLSSFLIVVTVRFLCVEILLLDEGINIAFIFGELLCLDGFHVLFVFVKCVGCDLVDYRCDTLTILLDVLSDSVVGFGDLG